MLECLYSELLHHINKSKVNNFNFLGGLLQSAVNSQKEHFFHSFRLHLKPYLWRGETVSEVCFNISYFLSPAATDGVSFQSKVNMRGRWEEWEQPRFYLSGSAWKHSPSSHISHIVTSGFQESLKGRKVELWGSERPAGVMWIEFVLIMPGECHGVFSTNWIIFLVAGQVPDLNYVFCGIRQTRAGWADGEQEWDRNRQNLTSTQQSVNITSFS